MAAERADLATWLAARRARGGGAVAWRLDLIEALQARAAAHQGRARGMLEARISALVAECEAMPGAGSGSTDAAAAGDGRREGSPLAELAGRLAARQRQRDQEEGRDPARPRHSREGEDPAPLPATGDGAAFAPPPALEASRRTWARLRTEAQLQQSLEQVDEDAGPLNSGRLVHRALTLMQQCSPGYLQHFVAYVDALSSLESLRAAATPEPRAAKPARTRKRV